MLYNVSLLSIKQSFKHTTYLISKKNHSKSNYIFPHFVQRDLPLSSHNMNIKVSPRALCGITLRIFKNC